MDAETGVAAIAGLEVAVYAGRIVDPSGAALQNEGSIVMGVGSALFEATEYSDGQLRTRRSRSTRCPPSGDVPGFGAEIVEREGADVHGLGETALPLCRRAVGNALRSLGIAAATCPCIPRRC